MTGYKAQGTGHGRSGTRDQAREGIRHRAHRRSGVGGTTPAASVMWGRTASKSTSRLPRRQKCVAIRWSALWPRPLPSTARTSASSSTDWID